MMARFQPARPSRWKCPMLQIERSIIRRIGLAVLSVLIAHLLMLPFHHLMGRSIFLFFFLAVLFSSWKGGLLSGILATILSVFSAHYYLFLESSYLTAPTWSDVPRLAIFIIVALIVSYFVDTARVSRQELEEAHRRLEERVRQQRAELELAGETLKEEISVRKDTEEALFESEAKFKDLFDNAPVGYHELDIEGRIVRINGTELTMLGYKADEVIDHNFSDFVAEGNVIVPATCDENHTDSTTELTLRKKDGSLLYVLAEDRLTRTADGKVTGIRTTLLDNTARRSAEAELAQERYLLNSLVENFPASIWFKDHESRFIKVNRHTALWFGAKDNTEMIGKSHFDYLPEDQAQLSFEEENRVMKMGIPIISKEKKQTIAGGREIWVSTTKLPLRDKDGKICGTFGITLDITERKRVQQVLAEERNLLRTLIDNLPEYIYIKDTESRFVLNNEAHIRVLGASSQDELIGQTDFDRFPKEFATRYYEDERELIKTGHPKLSYEEPSVDAEGEKIWVLTTKIPLRDSQGWIVGFVGVSRDITNRKRMEEALIRARDELEVRVEERTAELLMSNQALQDEIAERQRIEEALRENEERLARILETNADGISIVNKSGRIVFVNSSAERILGLRRAGITERTYDDKAWKITRADGSPIPKEELPFSKVMSTGRLVYGIEHSIERPDGKRVILSVNSAPLFDESGTITGVVSSISDITERKKAEEERAQLLIREREARKEAEAANRAKDEFLAILSHELRTPLHSVLGWARLLRTGKLDGSTLGRAYETIERNAKHQAQLIEDLLDVSRIAVGKLRMEAGPVDFIGIVNTVLDSIRPSAEAKGIRLVSILDISLGTVKGDAGRLQQVVGNLLSNAIKFTPANGQVELKLVKEGQYAKVSVKDTGQGISRDFLPHVFEIFRQADTTITRRHGGLGLGLAIAHHIVALHRGTITAESEGEGRGATFTVTLPLENDSKASQAG